MDFYDILLNISKVELENQAPFALSNSFLNGNFITDFLNKTPF